MSMRESERRSLEDRLNEAIDQAMEVDGGDENRARHYQDSAVMVATCTARWLAPVPQADRPGPS